MKGEGEMKRTNGLMRRLILSLGCYRLAAMLYESWRYLVRPHTHGALVAIWDGPRLLLVKASYRKTLSLPGGGVNSGETPRQAAVRELGEELGVWVRQEDLGQPWSVSELSNRGRNTVWIFPINMTGIRGEGCLAGCDWIFEPDGKEIISFC